MVSKMKSQSGLGEGETLFKKDIGGGITSTIAIGEEGNYNKESYLNAANVSKVKQKKAFSLGRENKARKSECGGAGRIGGSGMIRW